MTEESKQNETWFKDHSNGTNRQALVENAMFYLTPKSLRDDLTRAFRESNLGVIWTVVDIQKTLQMWGFTASLKMVGAEDLRLENLPVIAHLQGIGKFVLLHKVGNETVRFIDPECGWIESYIDNFKKYWRGVIVCATYKGKWSVDDLVSLKNERLDVKRKYKESISVIDDFLTPEESASIIKTAKSHFVPSEVATGGGNFAVDKIRTSSSAVLQMTDDPHIKRVYQKLEKMLSGVSKGQFEPIQCVKYEEGQEYRAHYDTINDDKKNPRIKSMLIYLNDEFEGGNTFFPEVDVAFEPKQGRAIVFDLLNEDRRINIFSLHAGLPVKSGVKYACNIWVREKPLPSN